MSTIRAIISFLINGSIALYFAAFPLLVAAAVVLLTRQGILTRRNRMEGWTNAFQTAKPGLLASIGAYVNAIASVVAWPVSISHGRWARAARSAIEYKARTSLAPVDRNVAVFDLFLIVSVLGFAAVRLGSQPLILAVVVAVTVGTGARHLSYLGAPLLLRLRRTPKNVPTEFAIVLACDAAVLVLAVAAIFDAPSLLHPNLQSINRAAVDLATLNNLPGILQQAPGRFPIAILAALAYAVVARQVIAYREFQRTDDDIREIASGLMLIGDYPGAKRWLEKEQSRMPQSFGIRAGIELGAGRLEAARRYAKEMQKALGEDDSLDVVLSQLWTLGCMLPWDKADREAFLLQEVEQHISDSTLSIQAGQSMNFGFYDPADLLGILAPKCPEARYPLTLAALMANAGEAGRAYALLEASRPGSDIEEVTRLIGLCSVIGILHGGLEHCQDDVRKWIDEDWPVIEELSANLVSPWRLTAMTLLFSLWVQAADAGNDDLRMIIMRSLLRLEEKTGQVTQIIDAYFGMLEGAKRELRAAEASEAMAKYRDSRRDAYAKATAKAEN